VKHTGTQHVSEISVIIFFVSTLSITEARARLSTLVDTANATHERFEITDEGRRVAVLLGVDDYDSLIATLDVLSDSQALSRHRVGAEQVIRGDVLELESLHKLMREAGRAVGPC
jgi:prevent-host-death family protein